MNLAGHMWPAGRVFETPGFKCTLHQMENGLSVKIALSDSNDVMSGRTVYLSNNYVLSLKKINHFILIRRSDKRYVETSLRSHSNNM